MSTDSNHPIQIVSLWLEDDNPEHSGYPVFTIADVWEGKFLFHDNGGQVWWTDSPQNLESDLRRLRNG